MASIINNPYLLPILMASAAGLVGSFALMRKMTLASDAISHIALPGIGLALLFKIEPLIGGAAALIAGAFLIWALERRTQITTETIVGVIFSTSLAIGSLITPSEELIDALFGGFTALSPAKLLASIVLAAGITTFMLLNKEKMVLSLVSRDLAQTSGINVSRLNLFFLLAFVLTIILGLRYSGVLLMGSLLIIPAAVAKNLARSLNAMLIISVLAAITATFLGLFLATRWDVETGPVIISSAALLFFFTLFLPKKI